MGNPDFIFNLSSGDIVFDCETYPNCFTLLAKHADTGQRWYFEISDRRYDLANLILFLSVLKQQGCRMVGYNNIGFDYPVVHFIYQNRNCGIAAADIYQKAMSIINAPQNARFAHMVWESDWLVDQLDLYKIHHFDNVARSTSLKVLEFNMRMDNIEDLPFDVGTMLTHEQMDELARYNEHDVDSTVLFLKETQDQIAFREQLTKKYDRNFMNHNDTKIGKDYFIMRLEEENAGCCYAKVDGKKKIRQTVREQIALDDVILDYIQFDQPEFNRILTWFKSQVIKETKGSIKDINCTIDGFQYDFGTGGIHGSIESQIVYSDEHYIIEDWDVKSYYPCLAIANRFHPEHLGETFCDIYKDVFDQRVQHQLLGNDSEQKMLKLALNGVYGDSNNQYSPFFDPQYTMSITVNGQLLLCLLAEKLLQLDQLSMIQINTDGLTIRYPREYKDWVHSVCHWWEMTTGLVLEDAEYSRFMVRDVNNYIAEYTSGDVKRKGAYEYELAWHQNHSALVVPMAAEAALVHGKDIREFITGHNDVMDFMLRTKVPRSSILEWGGRKVPNIVRYYISTDGDILEKVMPPAGPEGEYKRASKLTDDYFNSVITEVGLGVWDERIHTKNKSVYEERRTGINTGWTVQLCNNMNTVDISDINYEWYIKEAEKLVEPLRHG